MKKSFLIPAIVLYVVRVAFSNNVQVGTVLFTTTDLVRRCWSDYDKSLLRARAIMQDVLPDPDCLDFSNPESIVILLDYFHTCYKIISISTYGKVQHLLFLALSDAFGGYLRAHVLPYTRKSYYAGTVKYSEAQKLFLLYDDIKSFLKTDGRGWPVPSKAPLRTFKVKPLVIKKGSEEACNLLFIIERDRKKHHKSRNEKRSSKPSKLRRRVQREINTYNDTLLSCQNYLKSLSPQAEAINENENISGFGCRKKDRKQPPPDLKGGIFLGGSRKGGGNKEEVHKEEFHKEEFLKAEERREQARKEQARREEARKEEASREEARKEEARKHEDLKEEPITEDSCGEDLCKTATHKQEDQKDNFNIEDLFKDEDPKEEVNKEEEQKEDPCKEEVSKKTNQKEDPCKEDLGKQYHLKGDPHPEKESENQHRSKEDNLQTFSSTKKSSKQVTSKDGPSKEYSSTENSGKDFILKEVPCKEYILQQDPHKESSSTGNLPKEFVLQEDPCKEHSSTTKPSKVIKLLKNTHKEESSRENPYKEYIFQEDSRKEYSSTIKPSKDYKLENDPCKEYILEEDSRKEHSSTIKPSKDYKLQNDPCKEYILEEDSRKEYSSTIKPSKELENDPCKEYSSTESHYKEYVFQEEPSTDYPGRNENPSSENSGKESTFEKVFSKGGPCKEVFKEDTQTKGAPKEECQTKGAPKEEYQTQRAPKEECQTQRAPKEEYQTQRAPKEECQTQRAPKEECQTQRAPKEECQTQRAPKEECQTQGAPEEETREEEVIGKKTVEELPNREDICNALKKNSSKRKGRKRKHRKHKCHKCHKKKHSKQEVLNAEGQASGSKKTVMVPLPVLDDYSCPTSIALPFRKRPLRNLKAPSSAFILENYYTTVIRCFIAKGNRKRDIKDFNGQFQHWLTSKVLPLLGDEQWYPGFGGVLRVLETIKVLGADKYKGEECEDYGFLFNEGVEFSVDSSFGCKEPHKPQHKSVTEKTTEPLKRYILAIILIVSVVMLFLLCCCFYFCQTSGRRTTTSEEQQDYQESQRGGDPTYANIGDGRSNNIYNDGKKDPYASKGVSTYDNPKPNQGGEIWSFGDTRGIKQQQQQEAHFLTKHSRFPKEPRLLHNVHTLWKKPSNLMNRYWTSDETKCYKTEMRTLTCNCTESCHCTILTDSSAVTKAKTRKSSTVTFFEADDDVAHSRRNTSTKSSTQYSTTESGSEGFSSSEYSESSKSLRKHRNSTHYP